MRFPSIETHDGRRALAFLAIMGGCMVTTLHLFALTWLLREHPEYLIWLAGGAYGILIIGHTALGWQMGRRLLASVSRDGVTVDDKGAQD